ncbi:DUF4258 domain-containing protein [Piscibacillus sp. B03]|uniref:DUF4258 domain-containing protein n=1 Tax=Piscibacillus sp. B03 TaxID=3457430 RepID=UPI003FCDB092
MLKQIKKSLMNSNIVLTKHAVERMKKRGYIKRDLALCIMNGKIIEKQSDEKHQRVVIVGLDSYDNPIACVVQQNAETYHIVTVMPPYDQSRFDDVI